MDVVGRANVDHVYRLVGEQVVKRAISAINTQGVAVVLAAVGGAGKHSLNRDALAAERFEVGLAHKANTNDGGAKFGHKNENRRLTYVCVLAHRADYGETTLEISDEIIRVLYADGKPNQLVGDAHLLAMLGGNHGV